MNATYTLPIWVKGNYRGHRKMTSIITKHISCNNKGRPEEAHSLFVKACSGNSQPAAMYYNDQKPDKIFYQGLAYRKWRGRKGRSRFNQLITYGEEHLFDRFKMDYFAVSLPDLFDLGRRYG